MVAFHQFVQWFVQHPLAAATVLYAAAVCGVLVYAFFEPRAQTEGIRESRELLYGKTCLVCRWPF
jgi:hypothetical protein